LKPGGRRPQASVSRALRDCRSLKLSGSPAHISSELRSLQRAVSVGSFSIGVTLRAYMAVRMDPERRNACGAQVVFRSDLVACWLAHPRGQHGLI
jgi:hypothetical protein